MSEQSPERSPSNEPGKAAPAAEENTSGADPIQRPDADRDHSIEDQQLAQVDPRDDA